MMGKMPGKMLAERVLDCVHNSSNPLYGKGNSRGVWVLRDVLLGVCGGRDVDKASAVLSLALILLWTGEPEKERNEKGVTHA